MLTAVVLTLMTLAVTGSMVLLTTSLHDSSSALRETVRGVRIARESQVDLLRHERSADPDERARLEGKLRESIDEDFGSPATSAAASAERDEAKRSIERYFATPRDDPVARARLESALDALDPVSRASGRAADEALARAAHLDRLGNRIGATATVLMIVALAAFVVWTGRAVVRPTLALSGAMARFGHGDFTARAAPEGVADLRAMIHQFNAMGEGLARQHRARLTHLAGVAHDLRNPLAALQMSSALVAADQPLPPEPDIRGALVLVRRQVTRLNRMVEDLLDATRIDAGELALQPRETDLREVVIDVAALFIGVSKIHRLVVEVPETPLILRCDPLRIEQTLSNLVGNAMKYSPRGGAVRIRAQRESDVATVSVSDQGVGIPESDLDRIWEPFRRTGTSAGTLPGVGLGLWTAKRIADAHHGKIVVRSKAGVGSTCTLVLPLDARAAEEASQQISRWASPSSVSSATREGSHG